MPGTNQLTPFVLGQPDAQTNWLMRGLDTPNAVLMVGSKLLVADLGNDRVLIWNSIPIQSGAPADLVLGQEQVSTLFAAPPTGNQLVGAARISSDGTRLAVASDGMNSNRVVFWNQFPQASFQPGDFFIDPTLTPTMPAARTFIGASPLFAGGHLYLADRGYNRVLLWNSAPGTSTDADVALGQPGLTSGSANAGGLSSGSFSAPQGMPASDGTRLFVSDTGNHRILAWNTLPTASGPADFVLGQASDTAASANRGGAPSLATLNRPQGVSVGGSRLAVADTGNHRVLLWNQLPTTTGQAANIVLGQTDAALSAANAGGLSGSSLDGPTSVATDGTRIAVADSGNNRVLVWNRWPASNGIAADLVLGQTSDTRGEPTGRFASVSRYMTPVSVARAGERFIVVDRDANRLLLFPRLPRSAADLPDIVLGQSDFNSSDHDAGRAVSAVGLSGPSSASSDGTMLAVADTNNNRVMIWRSIPTQNLQPADALLGQASFTATAYSPGRTQLGFEAPQGVFVSNGRVYLADTNNNRVLIWKSITGQFQQPADIVLGQSSFTANFRNRGGNPAANTLDRPQAVFADASHIYVSDTSNSRVLIWNKLDVANGEAADLVLGQTDLTSNVRPASASASGFGRLMGLAAADDRLYVCDGNFNRVLFWNGIPAMSGRASDGVIGQSSLTSGSANAGGLASNRLQTPAGVLATADALYIADAGNGRVVVLPIPPR